jgi:hypothetical protein
MRLGLSDESAQTRLVAVDAVMQMDGAQLLEGLSAAETSTLLSSLGARTVENWVVVFVLDFGIPGALLLALGISYFIIQCGRAAGPLGVLASVAFLALSLTNNSFAAKGPPLAFFAILCVAFRDNASVASLSNRQSGDVRRRPAVSRSQMQIYPPVAS